MFIILSYLNTAIKNSEFLVKNSDDKQLKFTIASNIGCSEKIFSVEVSKKEKETSFLIFIPTSHAILFSNEYTYLKNKAFEIAKFIEKSLEISE
jgi:hypothetical protein